MPRDGPLPRRAGAILARVINICWFAFKWVVPLGALAAAIGVLVFHNRVNEEIRQRIQDHLARLYPDLQVTVRSAELVEGEGIKARGVRILEPGAEGPRAELLEIEELLLGCQTDLTHLVSDEPKINHIIVRRPRFYVTRRRDGTWSIAKLLSPAEHKDGASGITIEGGVIEVFDPSRNPAGTLTLHGVNLRWTRGAAEPGTARPPGEWQVRGTLAGDHLRRIEVSGSVDPQSRRWNVRGTIEGLDLSPALCDALPAELGQRLQSWRSLHAEGSFRFQLSCDPSAHQGIAFGVTGEIDGGRLIDPRLPRPLTDLHANIRCDNRQFAVTGLTGRIGETTISATALRDGYETTSPLVIHAGAEQLELVRDWLAAMPDSLMDRASDFWNCYLPAGRVNAGVQLTFDGRQWHVRELSVQCLNVSFSYHKFPYRLESGSGTVTLKDNVLRADLTAYSQRHPMRITAEYTDPMGARTGRMEARAETLPIDEKLLIALPDESEQVVRKLHPTGLIGCAWQGWRQRPGEPFHQHLLVTLKGCAIRYDGLPYPVRGIGGTLEMTDGDWTFRDLKGANDGTITARGHLKHTPDGRELYLRLGGTNVELENELRDALPPGTQQLWRDLRPRGVVGLDAEVRYLADQHRLSVGVDLVPHSETASIEPVYFPYRLEKLQGLLRYRDGQMTWKGFKAEHAKAEHGNVTVQSDGSCRLTPGGGWHLHLENLSIDRLRIDPELTRALPDRLKRIVQAARPQGQIDVRGSFDIARGTDRQAPWRAWWNLTVGLTAARLELGLPLENIHGEVALEGGFDGHRASSRGRVDLHSLSYKDFQFTAVAGPVWIDDDRAVFGRWIDRVAPPRSRQDPAGQTPTRPLTALLHGGTMESDCWIELGPVPRYWVHASLHRADLARCAQEVMPGHQDLSGEIYATVNLQGSGKTLNNLRGAGNLQLVRGNVYELPLLIRLLSVLGDRSPEEGAFSDGNIDFSIKGHYIVFDRIDFHGDALSLSGKGWMNFDRQIGLSFYPIVGRDDVQIPVMRELVGGASRQAILIHVGGTLDDPVPRKQVFPGVAQLLQELQNISPLPPELLPQLPLGPTARRLPRMQGLFPGRL